jgi:hypothetical protein
MKLTINRQAPNFVTLHNEDGAWVGPGLGDFRTARDAIKWAHANGHSVDGVKQVPICLMDIVNRINETAATVAVV